METTEICYYLVFWLSSFRRKKQTNKEHLLTVKTQYSSHNEHSLGQSSYGERTDSIVLSVTSTNTHGTCHQEPYAAMQQQHAVTQKVKKCSQSKKYCSTSLNNECNFLIHYSHWRYLKWSIFTKASLFSTQSLTCESHILYKNKMLVSL